MNTDISVSQHQLLQQPRLKPVAHRRGGGGGVIVQPRAGGEERVAVDVVIESFASKYLKKLKYFSAFASLQKGQGKSF